MDFEVRHIDGTTVKLISSEHKCAITSATQTRKLCGNDTVTINLASATYIEFQVGDKITIFGTTYTLNQLPTVKKESERSYSYTLVFEGLQYTLIDRVFLMPANTQGDNLMFDLAGMLRELATNINRGVLDENNNPINSAKPYEFVLDESLEETEYKNLSLTGKNCLQVLQQLCQEWDTEFVFAEEPTRIAIYIGVAGSTFRTTFKYGRGGGVYELNREKGAGDICTRLFVYGGTQNLTYYRHNRLCLPSKEKNQSYVEDATAQAVYGIKEQVKNFDDIYPNRIGTITSLSGCDYNEFIDSAMADSQYGFDLNEKWADNADDCEEWLALKGLEDTPENEAIYYNDVAGTATKYLMAGATAKIHFNTGALAGYECDLHSYTHSSQKFVLKPLVDENGYDFPSKTNAAFKLAVGDEYVILDINLPTAYKEEAESKLATEAASYFDTVCRPQPKYTLTIEPIALKHIVGPSTADTEIFKVGDLINISDPTGGVESATIRIDQFVRNLLDPFDYKLTLTDEITYSQQVRTLIEVDAIKRVVEESKIYDVNRIRRGWKDAEELYNQMFDTEGHYYSEKIAPLSIDTQMLKVGARSQQLVLQNVLFQPNYNANPANLQISAGSLVHYTIAEPDIKTWTMSAYSGSNVPSTAQYVYAKCAKNGTTGTWLVTDQAIIFDSDPSYYHFLVGSLSSVDSVSNTRNFAATYGFTTINGRNITTGVIKSADGSGVIIDLNEGIIKGNITFESGTTSYDALQSIIGNNSTVQSAATTANTANATANRAEGKIDGLEIGGRNLLQESTQVLTNTNTDTKTRFDLMIMSVPTKAYSGNKTMLATQQITTTGHYTKTFATLNDSQAYYRIQHSGNARDFYLYFPTSVAIAAGETLTISFDVEGANPSVANGLVVKNFKLEKGNRASDWSPAPEDVNAEIAAEAAAQTAALGVLANRIDADIADLQNQIDGRVETWFGDYEPTDQNEPWYTWRTQTPSKEPDHLGDMFYDNITGYAYRFINSGTSASPVYGWLRIADSDVEDALALAREAKTAADGKMTVFTDTPTPPYQEGDMWVQGANGDILYCATAKAEGQSYAAADWVIASKYIDQTAAELAAQTAVDDLEIGGRNLLLGSGEEKQSANYLIATYVPSSPLESGKEYTISLCVIPSEGTNSIDAYVSQGYKALCLLGVSGTSEQIVTKTFTATYSSGRTPTDDIRNGDVRLYRNPNPNGGSATCTIKWVKIEKGSKSTDWTPAPEDVDDGISNAQSAAAAAQQSANTANTTISNMNNDAVFSKLEKKSFRVEWKNIQGSVTADTTYTSDGSYAKAIAAVNGTTVGHGTLDTAYTNLKNYLIKWKLDTNEDTDTPASGSGTFSQGDLGAVTAAYYNAETALYDALADYWSEEKARQAVNNMTIGAKNIASRANVGYLTNAYTESNHVYTQSAGNGAGLKFASTLFTVGEKYVLTFKIKKVSGTLTAIGGHSNGFTSNVFYVDGVKSSKTYTQGQTITDDTNTHKIEVYLTFNGNETDNNLYIQPNRGGYNTNNNVFQMWDIMLVQGTKATDWSPAPEDTEAEIAVERARLDNINSDTVFSVSEKENYRTDFEKIVGLGIPVAGYIPTAAELAEGSYNHGVSTYDCSKGTFYQHYSLIRATATNTLGALSTAYTNLRTFLVNVGLYVNTDYTSFSRTALAELICAYLDAEKAIDLYASTVGTLTATTDTAESTQRKELTINTPEGVTSAMLSDMLVDEDMRMLIHFDNKLTTQSLYFGLPVIPNGVSGDTARFSYMGRTTAQQCKINVTGAEFVVKFSAKSSSYVTYIAESEQALQQDVMFSGAMALAGGVYGGLALLSLLVLRNAAGQQMAGMNGLEDSDLALWAGGALEEALNNNVPVWIKRDGSARFGKLRFDNGRIYWQDGGTERFVIQDTVGLQTANRVFNPSNQNDNNTFDTLTNITITTINSTSSSSPTVATIQALQALNNATAYTYYNGMDVYIEIQVSLYCTNSGTGGTMHVILQYTDNGSTWYDVPNAIWTWNLAPSTTGESQVFDPTLLSFVYNASSIPSSTGYKSAIGLRMAAWKDSGLTSVSFDTSGTKWHYYKDISKMRTAIGKNGFGVMLNANNLFSSFVNNNDSELTTTIKGNTDIPGVLWAGNISSGASVLPHYKNAAKYASSQLECDNWNSTNKYFRITHRLGTGNFTAMVTPTSSAVTARTTKDGTYLYVYLSAQASFDLVLFGTN